VPVAFTVIGKRGEIDNTGRVDTLRVKLRLLLARHKGSLIQGINRSGVSLKSAPDAGPDEGCPKRPQALSGGIHGKGVGRVGAAAQRRQHHEQQSGPSCETFP
jgi:hypothetical protein